MLIETRDDLVAEFDYTCADCKKTIRAGTKFRLTTEAQSGYNSKKTFLRYHLPECPKKEKPKPSTRRIRSRYAQK